MYFLASAGCLPMNSVVSVAAPPCQGACASPRMYLAITPASRMRRLPLSGPAVPVASGVWTASTWPAASAARCWPIGNSITRVPPAPARSSTAPASVLFCMPGPQAMRLPLSSAMVLTGLSLGTRNSSSTCRALLGLVAMILNSPGAASAPTPRLPEPVPLALPSQPRGHGPVADANLGRAAGAHDGRHGQHPQRGDALAQQLAAAGGGCGRGVVEGHGFSCGGWRSLAVQAGLHAAR